MSDLAGPPELPSRSARAKDAALGALAFVAGVLAVAVAAFAAIILFGGGSGRATVIALSGLTAGVGGAAAATVLARRIPLDPYDHRRWRRFSRVVGVPVACEALVVASGEWRHGTAACVVALAAAFGCAAGGMRLTDLMTNRGSPL